jgi:hypothetical protein
MRRARAAALLLASLCVCTLARSVDARRSLHQSDETGETGDGADDANDGAIMAPGVVHTVMQHPSDYPAQVTIPGTTLLLRTLKNYPQAVCNDGSPGGYYWSQGDDPSLWVVYLQGGARTGAGAGDA